jgi:Tol biopolymer transport system component
MRYTFLLVSLLIAVADQNRPPAYDLAFVLKEAGPPATSKASISVSRGDGSAAHVVATETFATFPSHAWSPDGSTLVINSFRATDEEAAKACRGYFHLPMYVINVASGTAERVSDLLAQPGVAWSPDGRQLAFASACEDPVRDSRQLERGDSYATAIYVVDLATRKATRVTGFEKYGNPAWAPDGRRIAFQGNQPGSNESAVYVVDADGKNQRLLATGIVPRWSPRGDRIAYGVPRTFERRDASIFVMAPDGTGSRRVAALPNGFHFEWSPDGASLLVPHPTMLLIDVETGVQRELGPTGIDPVFSPDGRSIIMARDDAIVSVSVDAPASPRTLVAAPAGQNFMFGSFAVSPTRK